MTQTASLEESTRTPLAFADLVGMAFVSFPGVVALVLVSPTSGYQAGEAVMATSALLFGAWCFWTHGGNQITGAGVFSLASAVFVGYSGLWWLNDSGSYLPGVLFYATALAYFTHVAMYFLFWRRDGAAERYPPLGRLVDTGTSTTVTIVGLLALVGSIALARIAPSALTAFTAGSGAGVLLVALGLSMRPEGQRIGLWRTLTVVAVIGVYVETIFTGYGRLIVVAVALSAATAVCTRLRGRSAKLIIIVGAPFAVTLLNSLRTDAVLARYGSAAGSSNKGPGSMESPLQTFAELLRQAGNFTHGDGSTFFASVAVFIPRDLWHGKPVGFGTELTAILNPDLLAAKHSMAGLSAGEWYFNFGAVGLVFMVFALGKGVQLVDRLLVRRLNGTVHTPSDAFRLAIPLTLVAGLSDLVWVGTFTYISRSGFIVITLVILMVFAPLVTSREQTRRRQEHRRARS